MLHKRVAGLLLLCLMLPVLAGCARAQAQIPAQSSLLGSWYESQNGGEYQFISNDVLVLPKTQATGGNAVTYRVLGDKLDVATGQSHFVSEITSLTTDILVLTDPVAGTRQQFYRDLSRTRYVKSVEATAATKISQFATVTVDPAIVWVFPRPTGKGTEWTGWSPKTLATYQKAWVWTTTKRDQTPVKASGGGDSRGYSFTFARKLPTAEQLQTSNADSSIEATAGLQLIDVGYSASKVQYPAGTMVYLPAGLVFSLGDGFAIAVDVDRKGQSFVPATHK